jgi:hypothetical protein
MAKIYSSSKTGPIDRRNWLIVLKLWNSIALPQIQKAPEMKYTVLGFERCCTLALAVMVALGTLMLAQPSHAAACVNGVYRAGCVGPHGAVGVRKPYPRHYGYRYHGPVSCGHGPYRAGCVGPHGGAVVRRPY